jgi:hypothetical protein
LDFFARTTSSTPFHVLHKEVFDYDCAQLKVTITTDFEALEGFSFRWSFVNPLAFRFAQISLFLLSVQFAYALFLSIQSISIDQNLFTQLFCVLLGAAGVLASNPFTLLLPAAKAHLSDHVAMAVYTALLRMFGLIQLELIRAKGAQLNFILLTFFAGFFVVYGIIDEAAAYDRAQLLAGAENEISFALPIETLRMGFHLVYAFVVACWMVLAFVQGRKQAGKRLAVVALCCAVAVGEVLFWQFQWKFLEKLAFTVIPQIAHAAVNLTVGAFLMFLMRNDRPTEYRQIDLEEENGGVLMEDFGQGGEEEDKFVEEEEEEGESEAAL